MNYGIYCGLKDACMVLKCIKFITVTACLDMMKNRIKVTFLYHSLLKFETALNKLVNV
jgi:hypothetical protein